MTCERTIISAVQEIRTEDNNIGCYKLWQILISLYGREFVPGRDSFYRLLRRNKLMLPPAKPRCTTNSNHRFRKYKNLIKDLVPVRPNQVWVADITYIPLACGDVCYLHLITDAYSRMIIGYCVAKSLRASCSIEALNMAIEQAINMNGGNATLSEIIHHSDRGIQYCCDAYVDLLRKYNITSSMTEKYKPTDNAIAERVNGIIKQGCINKRKRLLAYDNTKQLISRYISFYNHIRVHMSLGNHTPAQVHFQKVEPKRMWKPKIYHINNTANEQNTLPLPSPANGDG